MIFLGDKLDQHCSLESLIPKMKLCLNKRPSFFWTSGSKVVRRQIGLDPAKWKPSACIKDRTSRAITMKLDLRLNLNPIWKSVLMDTPDWAFLEFTSHISFFFVFWYDISLVCVQELSLWFLYSLWCIQLKKAFWAETSHFITVSSAICNASTNS